MTIVERNKQAQVVVKLSVNDIYYVYGITEQLILIINGLIL
jgi:hypothetical protein